LSQRFASLDTDGARLHPNQPFKFNCLSRNGRLADRLQKHPQGKETVMNIKGQILFSTAIAILSATASFAEIKTDYDRNADFTRYKTYSASKRPSIQPSRRKMFDHFPPDSGKER
jgi:hypothetical protein